MNAYVSGENPETGVPSSLELGVGEDPLTRHP